MIYGLLILMQIKLVVFFLPFIVIINLIQIIQPRQQTEPFFDIPEFEYNILSNHLKQALGSMSIDPEPIQSFDAMLNDKSYLMTANNSIPLTSTSYNLCIYGNDVDTVDIATRVAMVRFFNSPNILGNFNEHTRTLRLHPRAVVAFQYSSFIRSRPVKSAFVIRLAKTQVKTE
jgi:hypothetical protein